MKTIDTRQTTGPVFQGDLMITKVVAMPQGAAKAAHNIVAHSETGHHHVADNAAVYVPQGDDMTLFMRSLGKTKDTAYVDIVHQRDWDTHETIRLLDEPGTVWRVRRQREYTPAGWRRVED